MAVPKFKTSKANTHARRSQWKASAPKLTTCPKCKSEKLAHRACTVCGTYKGRVYDKAKLSVEI
ncbi:MAG: 50S ribosomal protein L32 [Bifidobacteriaceae bacterium]|nr:50S ribosomal protein L32 [Bifidobacteriaceae bacterium]